MMLGAAFLLLLIACAGVVLALLGMMAQWKNSASTIGVTTFVVCSALAIILLVWH